MHAEELKRAQKSRQVASPSPLPSKATRQSTSSPPFHGHSFSRTIEDDVKGSMQAVGQICRAAVIGVFLCGFGGIATLLGLLIL